MQPASITVAQPPHSRAIALLGSLLAMLLAAMLLAPANSQAKVYFSAFLAEGGTGIERAGFDGSGLETLQFEPAGFEDALAVDTDEGTVYWTDTDASVIGRANLNGSEAHIVLDDFGQEPLGIALDVADGKMYWTDDEGVKRANLNGSEPELLTKEPARGFIALDLEAQRMYWADYKSGDIKTAAMTLNPAVTNLVSKQASPFGIAVDPAAGKVYWLDLNLEKRKSESDLIRSAKLNGSEVRTLLQRPGAGFEGGLAVEPAAGKLYWTEAGARDIGVSNLDGSDAETLFSTGEDVPEGLAVETADPHPTNTVAPTIEGSAQADDPQFCDAGTWTGIGPISFSYQWAVAGGPSIEGATDSTYVPSDEEVGDTLVCVVTASDVVETTTATSPGVTVLDSSDMAGPPTAAVVETPLIAGIAIAKLTSSGTKARVPVFTSLAGTATLRATAVGKSHAATPRPRSSTARTKTAGSSTARTKTAGSSAARSKTARSNVITMHQRLSAGRHVMTLTKLVAGTTYRLLLTFKSTDGQRASDTASLKIARR